MSLRLVHVDRYVTPLREGGSMPAVVEADDLGMYVLKFRGAGQGPKALIAEIIAGELARAAGLPVPEIVLAQLDPELARTDPDPEIQDLIRASAGLNMAMDYLPGAANFDAARPSPVDAELASRIVWFDAFVSNVDRSTRNPNLMLWHRRLWLIDHGAALYIHHGWDGSADGAGRPFERIADHVLLRWASVIGAVDAQMAARLTPAVIDGVLAKVPDDWLAADATLADAAAWRRAYANYLGERLRQRAGFVAEAERAHAQL
ncbi:MAG: aminotransferase class I and II [Xanthomonadales bacterium]|nr:aminotransferase class I and II [Xanthomonadales bacterium]